MDMLDLIFAMASDEECPNNVLIDAIEDLRERGSDVAVSYLVTGESGSYSDWRLWPVAMFLSKEAAESFKQQCQEWFDEHHDEIREKHWDEDEPKSPYDKGAKYSYDGIVYKIEEVPLKG